MELKFIRFCERVQRRFGSNRTFMELKCPKYPVPEQERIVLIVPLWN